eukprot:CAMPEP_0171209574 /NCGR_PEP_ID=MMETSP0790-20130122/28664_1 /TAXON_ID=2925 /ORGANISM="Alexandrium catenella, Strain OF101" /LENGTH=167 /DNA_ID=CAMNT_0011675185 /DNA_START=282 /DNA_END=782 /DNA_ORIENTATION=-
MARVRRALLLPAAVLFMALLHPCTLRPVTAFLGVPQRGSRTSRASSGSRPGPLALQARGGARGGEGAAASDEGPNGVLVFFGALLGLYAAFVVNYGFFDCTDGNFSPFQVTKCAVADTLYGIEDTRFTVGCKLKLIEAAGDAGPCTFQLTLHISADQDRAQQGGALA